jgi:hypothetical protein
MVLKIFRLLLVSIVVLTAGVCLVAQATDPAPPGSKATQPKIISDPSGMLIEIVGDSTLPTKVLVLNPPKPADGNLQQPHGWTPVLRRSNPSGEIDITVTTITSGGIPYAPI